MNGEVRPAAMAGTIRIGDDLTVSRMGYGAMRLPGPGVWGEPADRDTALAVLRRAIELGVNLIDTAGYYGEHVADRLIVEALFPYPPDLVIVTKVGAQRDPDLSWHHAATPKEIRTAIEEDLQVLRLEQLDLVHCRFNPASGVPLAESVGECARLREEGKIRHIGLSNIELPQIAEAQQIVPIVSVQNRYSAADRAGEDVLQACTERGIVFMPYFPLAIGEIPRQEGALAEIALAWLLARSAVMVPIPGTSSVKHLDENVAAAAIRLTEADIAELTAA